MGVPGLFAWLVGRDPRGILRNRLPDKGCGSGRKRRVLYLDLNGLIHPAVRTDPNLEYTDMNAAVLKYIVDLVRYVRPDEVFAAVDGVAPAAKMGQQRERRFRSAKEARVVRDLHIKHGKQWVDRGIDFNMISPGTQFMVDLQTYLRKELGKAMTAEGVREVTLSGADVPGEGEHKIMAELRERRKNGVSGEQTLIYGLDADLIFLSLIANCGVHLVRENMQFSKRHKYDEFDPERFPYLYMNVNALRERLVHMLSPHTPLSELKRYGIQETGTHAGSASAHSGGL